MEFLTLFGIIIGIVIAFVLLLWFVKFMFASIWVSKLISLGFAIAALVIAVKMAQHGKTASLKRSSIILPVVSFIFLMSQIIMGDPYDFDIGISLYQILSLVGWGIGSAAVLFIIYLIFHYALFLVFLFPILLIIADVLFILAAWRNPY